MTTQTTTRQLIQHKTSGERFALETNPDGTMFICGPLLGYAIEGEQVAEDALPFDEYNFDDEVTGMDLSDYRVIRSE